MDLHPNLLRVFPLKHQIVGILRRLRYEAFPLGVLHLLNATYFLLNYPQAYYGEQVVDVIDKQNLALNSVGLKFFEKLDVKFCYIFLYIERVEKKLR